MARVMESNLSLFLWLEGKAVFLLLFFQMSERNLKRKRRNWQI